MATNNMSAFWEQTWWRMLWVDKSLDQIIESSILRMPLNLLTDRAVRRHQKVIDTATNEVVGYARWILPESCADCWLEARVPDVSDKDRLLFRERFASAEWSPREDMKGFDAPLDNMMQKHAPKGVYLSKFITY